MTGSGSVNKGLSSTIFVLDRDFCLSKSYEMTEQVVKIVCSENWDPIAASLSCVIIIVMTFVHAKWLVWG